MRLSNLNLHDFGIFLELEPDEEEQAQLEAKHTSCFTTRWY